MTIGLQKLSHTHESIMDWILLNPGATLQECGNAFGYTAQGIGYIIRSDAFRAKLAERRAMTEILIAADIPAKLQTLATLAVDKVTEIAEKTGDPELLVDIMDKTLHRLGYAPTRGAVVSINQNVQQNNNFAATPEELARAREIMLQSAQRIPMLAPPIPAQVETVVEEAA